MEIKITEVEGIRKIADALGKHYEVVAEAVRVGVYSQGLTLYELLVRNRMIPVKSGRLLASHYVTLPEMSGGKWTVEIGAGAPYAAEVHEKGRFGKDGSVRRGGYSYSAVHGAPQWLRRGKNMWATSYAGRLRDTVAKALKTGVAVAEFMGTVPTEPHDSPGAGVDAMHRRTGYSATARGRMRAIRKLRVVRWVGKSHQSGYARRLKSEFMKAAGRGKRDRYMAIREAMNAYRLHDSFGTKEQIGLRKIKAAEEVLKRRGIVIKPPAPPKPRKPRTSTKRRRRK